MPDRHSVVVVFHALHVLWIFKSPRGLSQEETEYDPARTLLRSDITLKAVHIGGYPVEVLMINIKKPKEAHGNLVKVELFANGSKSYPVKTYKKLLQFLGRGKNWQVPLMTKMNSTL